MIYFFDLKKKLILIISILAASIVGCWFFDFSKDDLFAVARSVVPISKPNIPITVNYRESFVGKGYVAIIKNNSKEKLELKIDLSSSAENIEKMAGSFVLEPAGNIEIGWVEGWQFKTGDKITISHDDYQAGAYIISSEGEEINI
ncbi:MAG: hypothetical protein ABFR97_06210 [Thermodesulfobacteriota bacterium]